MESNSQRLELVPLELTGAAAPDATDPPNTTGVAPPTLALVDPAPDGPGGDLTINYPDPEARPIRTAAVVASDQKPDEGAGAGADPAEAPPDRFLHEAAKQYRDGHIDQQLWTHTLAQAKGDKTAAIAAYLKARSESLRRIDRDQQAKARARALREAGRRDADPDSPGGGLWPHENDRGAPRAARPRYFYPALAAAGLAVVVACGWLVNAFWLSVPADKPAPTVQARPAPAAPARVEKPAAAPASNVDRAAKASANEEFMSKITELSNAGNWNVLVLYATEWTRREPQNAAAWNQLGIGFSNLRQYSDARDAAATAVKLAPKEAHYWRNLGQASLDQDQPAEALRAFEEAAKLNVLDVHSIVETGLLNVRLGHLPEAKQALDLALAASPGDPDVLCLKSLVMQPPGAPKEVIITNRPLPPADARCRAPIAVAAPAPAATATITTDPAARPAQKRR